ncbi:TetR family transcriptional regulator [Streptomyces sp. NRRL F-5123]|uniref:TetR family transcriptional regulator n=1 Tax=Streptomyces sp. NRRL F-5123 TaxID=1463856 RepID=UPI0005BD140C|nr:TetR family transcriptional regulator [Streptomyces sp. NRRL F-5123]
MAYDAEDTRRRIFAAASAEFAEHGLAGARVNRIAAAARANKQAIYLYYGSKEELFAAVLHAKLEEVRVSLAFDPDAVAESVGQVFDWYQEHPELIRLLLWEALEVPDAGPGGASEAASEAPPGGDEHGGSDDGSEGDEEGGKGDGKGDGAAERERRSAFREKVRQLAGATADDPRPAQDLLFTLMGLIAWNFAVPRMCRMVLDEDTDRAALARRRETVVATARVLAANAP